MKFTQRQVMHRNLMIMMFVFVLGITIPLSTSAHYEGDAWAWSYWPSPYHHVLQIQYDSDCANWVSAADNAANGWTWTATPVLFSKVGCTNWNLQSGKVDIFTGNDSNPDHLASTWNYEHKCFLWSCWWDASFSGQIEASVIRLNTTNRSFGSLSAAQQQAAVTHELGHSLGLAHAGYYAGESNGGYSIMDYCCYSYNTPQSHDIADINALYPGW